MNKVEFADTEMQTISYKDKKGADKKLHIQTGFLHNGGKYPEKFETVLADRDSAGNPIDPKPYAVGEYEIRHVDSVYNNKLYTKHEFVPLKSSAKT